MLEGKVADAVRVNSGLSGRGGEGCTNKRESNYSEKVFILMEI
jgi:hypothetical protein